VTEEALWCFHSGEIPPDVKPKLSAVARRHFEFDRHPLTITTKNYKELVSLAPDRNDISRKLHYLLDYIAQKSGSPGQKIALKAHTDYPVCFATNAEEFQYYFQHAREAGFLDEEGKEPGTLCWLTPKGWDEAQRLTEATTEESGSGTGQSHNPQIEYNVFTGKPIDNRYEALAARLLEVEDFPLLLPPLSFKNIRGLSDEDDQHLSAKVCGLTSGMTAEKWGTLSEEQRIPWLQEAVTHMQATGPSPKGATTVFYSWQSDLPNATNRGFINECLEKAIKALNVEQQFEVEPCLDRDTLNVPGSPDIARTIFDKSENCIVFVGDVSITNYRSAVTRFLKRAFGVGPRPSPNPNVLVELGYAAKTLTWDKIVCVANEEYGDVSQLPFDLRQRRTLTYRLEKGQGKSDARKGLIGGLKDALSEIIGRSLIDEEDKSPTVPVAEVLQASAECGPPEVKPKEPHIAHARPVLSKEEILWVVNAYVHLQPRSKVPLNVPLHQVSGKVNGKAFEKVYFKSDPRHLIKTTDATLLIEGEGRFRVEGILREPYRETDFPQTLSAEFHLPVSELGGRSFEVTLSLTKTDRTEWSLRWEKA
jgi:hypothetical protein